MASAGARRGQSLRDWQATSPNGRFWRKAAVPIVVRRELVLGIADIERAFPSVFLVCSALASIHTFKGFLNFLLPQ